MRNDKRACIFEHEGFTYVCNFESMTVWVVTEEDENPVTSLEYTRHSPGVWAYRPEGSDAAFTIDNDQTLANMIDTHYEQYLNRLIVGKDGRATHIPKAVQMSRVRASD